VLRPSWRKPVHAGSLVIAREALRAANWRPVVTRSRNLRESGNRGGPCGVIRDQVRQGRGSPRGGRLPFCIGAGAALCLSGGRGLPMTVAGDTMITSGQIRQRLRTVRAAHPARGICRTRAKESVMRAAFTPGRLTGLAAVAGAAALLAVPGSAATASPAAPARAARAAASATSIPAISINSATLVANGAAIRVVFTATCGAGDDGSVSSTTPQAAGDRVAQGAAQTGFTCTGKPQQVAALAAANVNGAPFRPGIAVVMASAGDCPSANCTGASANKVLSISR
jgi:hypothetical protein